MDYYYDFDAIGTGFIGLIIVLGLILLAILIVGIVANWKLFKKAGKNGWECIVPIYGYYVLAEIAGLNWWWFLLMILDVVLKFEVEGLTLAINICTLISSFNCYYNIARKFGKDKTVSIFAGLFPFIFILIFGFSKNEVYDKNIAVSKNGIFGPVNEDNVNTSSTEVVDKDEVEDTEVCYCGNCGTKINKDIRFCPNCGKENV